MANVAITLQKLANEATAKTFKYNKEEAATSRAWQKEMSDTSHQREVKDLIAAGLNPVLSSGGSGAQAYSTQSASGVAESAVNAIGNYESAKTSAAATRYAAQQQAAATRAAASAAAAAQMYAADKSYESTKYQVTHSKTGFVIEAAKNVVNKLPSDLKSAAKKIVGDMASGSNSKFIRYAFSNDTFVNKNSATKNNFILTSNARKNIGNYLRSLGMNPDFYMINNFVKATYFKDTASMKWIAQRYKAHGLTYSVSRAR